MRRYKYTKFGTFYGPPGITDKLSLPFCGVNWVSTCLAEVTADCSTLTCVGSQVTLRDPIWQVMLHHQMRQYRIKDFMHTFKLFNLECIVETCHGQNQEMPQKFSYRVMCHSIVITQPAAETMTAIISMQQQ